MENQPNRFRSFLARKQIEISLKRYFVDAMGAMAFGLFASLLIGTIFDAIADQTGWAFLAQASEFCSAATGPAMAVAIGYALQAFCRELQPVVFRVVGVHACQVAAVGGEEGVSLCLNLVGGQAQGLVDECFVLYAGVEGGFFSGSQ